MKTLLKSLFLLYCVLSLNALDSISKHNESRRQRSQLRVIKKHKQVQHGHKQFHAKSTHRLHNNSMSVLKKIAVKAKRHRTTIGLRLKGITEDLISAGFLVTLFEIPTITDTAKKTKMTEINAKLSLILTEQSSYLLKREDSTIQTPNLVTAESGIAALFTTVDALAARETDFSSVYTEAKDKLQSHIIDILQLKKLDLLKSELPALIAKLDDSNSSKADTAKTALLTRLQTDLGFATDTAAGTVQDAKLTGEAYLSSLDPQILDLLAKLTSNYPVSVSEALANQKKANEEKDELSNAWDKSELPDYCYPNQASLAFVCPTDFPDRAGQQCFKNCNDYEVNVNWNTPSGTTTKKTKMVRDVTGTCRETCFEVTIVANRRVETAIPNCYILLGVTYHNWCSGTGCTRTMFSGYWHSQKWKANNIFRNSAISITNYNDKVTCMAGLTKVKIMGLPFCRSTRTRECVRDFGYKVCTQGGCGKGTAECVADFKTKAFAIAESIVKLICLPASAALLLIANVLKLIVTALKVITAAATKIYQFFFKLDQLVAISDDPDRSKQIIIRKKKTVGYLLDNGAKACSTVTTCQTKVDTYVTDLIALAKTENQTAAYKLFKSDFFKNFISNCKSLWDSSKSDIDGIFKDSKDFVEQAGDVSKQIPAFINKIQGKALTTEELKTIDDMKKAGELDKPLEQLTALFGWNHFKVNDENANLASTRLNTFMEKFGLQYVLAGVQIFGKSFTLLNQKGSSATSLAAIQNDAAVVNFFKDTFSVLNNIDPTGITGVISAFIAQRCEGEEDIHLEIFPAKSLRKRRQ